ncbi:hypothetical protein B0H14DRAFT_2856217 [Mycena olivaceomarginata]|nr:hypothetical protein B0H14DRAFT_2856217 [Mycena olivaceomarginata]
MTSTLRLLSVVVLFLLTLPAIRYYNHTGLWNVPARPALAAHARPRKLLVATHQQRKLRASLLQGARVFAGSRPLADYS